MEKILLVICISVKYLLVRYVINLDRDVIENLFNVPDVFTSHNNIQSKPHLKNKKNNKFCLKTSDFIELMLINTCIKYSR